MGLFFGPLGPISQGLIRGILVLLPTKPPGEAQLLLQEPRRLSVGGGRWGSLREIRGSFALPSFLKFEGLMEIDRADGRTPNQLRPLSCSRGLLNRAHGSASWSQGNTQILAAVYGPKAGTKKNENPERASFEVIWKPKSGQIGKQEKEYEMILKRTMQSICILTANPNTTTSVIVQVVHDDGALLPCAINAACAALVDAGIPLKHLAVSICCSLVERGIVMLDPTKLEEEKMKAFAYLVFPNSSLSTKGSAQSENDDETEQGLITSVTHGVMSVDDYLHCLERGRAATAKLSDFLRRNLQPQLPSNASKAG